MGCIWAKYGIIWIGGIVAPPPLLNPAPPPVHPASPTSPALTPATPPNPGRQSPSLKLFRKNNDRSPPPSDSSWPGGLSSSPRSCDSPHNVGNKSLGTMPAPSVDVRRVASDILRAKNSTTGKRQIHETGVSERIVSVARRKPCRKTRATGRHRSVAMSVERGSRNSGTRAR